MLLKKLMIFLLFLNVTLFSDVGFTELTFKNKNSNRDLNTAIWYPSSEKANDMFLSNIAFEGFKAKKDAKIKNKKNPLIIIAHGTSGNYRNLSWLASKLAKKNYFVLASNHPDYTSKDSNAKSVLKMWKQAQDISFLIDMILNSSYKNYIDEKNIFVLGYSLGAYSSMALVGARLDMRNFKDFCRKNRDKSCKYFEKAFSILDENYYKNSSEDFSDNRVKGSIAIAPGFVPMMTKKSLESIKKQTLVIGAEFDKNVPIKTQLIPYLKEVSKKISFDVISDSSHFSFMQICKPKAKIILEEEEASFVCEDGLKKTRKQIHKELYEKVFVFLEKNKS